MYDSNNREIRTGDFVTVSGAYFKNNNGLWLVTSAGDEPNNGSVWMHKVKKTGELCISRAGTTASLPMGYYCSDWKKNRAAKEHDRENLRYEVTEGVNPWYAAEYFKKESAEYAERAENQRQHWGKDSEDAAKTQSYADYYAAVAERLSASAEQPKQKEPETGIKFYYNGIKVDGERLIPCWYSLDNNKNGDPTVSILARDYKHLPRQYFKVENHSDPYTDYFDSDSTILTPAHPLYRFARYVTLKGMANGKTCYRMTEAQETEWKNMKDPGQPTAKDLAAVEEMKTAQESARLAAEHAAELAERERVLRQRNEGKQYIIQTAEKHPIVDGAPTVTVCWSEHPAFCAWADDELKLSVAAAENIMRHFDDEQHNTRETEDGHGWYFKTKVRIEWTDEETGEAQTYTGRYDLGDGDGGLIEHIRSWGRWCRTHDEKTHQELSDPPQELSENEKLADWLETFTEGGRIVNVEIAPGVIDLLEYRKKQEQQKKEQVRESVQDMYDAVAMLTDEQIEAAVFCIDPEDKEKIDVARFFLQELTRRDEKRALEVFRRWRGKEA